MRKIIIILLFSISGAASAQFPPEVLWWDTYREGDGSAGNCVRETNDGGFIMAGLDNPIGTPYTDACLVKTDHRGNEIWSQTYGYGGSEYFYSVELTDDGGYIAVGKTNSFAAYTSYVYLVKTDALGDTLWVRTYNSEEGSNGREVKQTQDGGYIIAGYIAWYEGTDPEWRILLLKYDSAGNLEWDQIYDDWNAYAWSIIELEEGGYVFTGQENSVLFNSELLLMKADESGELVWSHFYGGPLNDGGRSVQRTFDGGFIVAGSTRNSSFYQMCLLKTGSDGDTLWTRDYGGSEEYESAQSVVQTFDGGYALTGDTESFGAGYKDIYVVRTDCQGDTIWTGVYGEPEYDSGSCIQQTSEGGFIIAGRYRDVAGDDNAILIRLGWDGVLVEDRKEIQPVNYQLLPAYPNPFNGSTVLGFELRAASEIELAVYDVLGQKVWGLGDRVWGAGAHEVVWNAEGMASGVYLVRLSVDGQVPAAESRHHIKSRKVVLVK